MRILFLISIMVSMLVFSGIVAADANVTTNIETTGDVNLETNVDTDGDVTVWIDGTNMGDTLTEMGDAINGQGNYIVSNEDQWSQDKKGITSSDLAEIINSAVGFLFGGNANNNEEQIGSDLDAYFASDEDTYYIGQRINSLELEAEAVSRTLQDIAPDAYCRAKIDMMIEYGFTSVDCGNITYYHWNVHNSPEVTKIIGITSSDRESSKIGGVPNLDYFDIPESFRNYIPGETRPIIVDFSPESITITDDSVNLFALTNAPTECWYKDDYFAIGDGNGFSLGQGGLAHETEVAIEEDGIYEYYIRCADSYGKMAYSPHQESGHVVASVTRDTTGPEISCLVTEQLMSYTSTESEVRCAVSDLSDIESFGITGIGVVSPEPCGSGYCLELNIDDLEEGTFSLSATSVDDAGNENSLDNFAEITVDKTPLPEEEPLSPLEIITVNVTGFLAGISGLF